MHCVTMNVYEDIGPRLGITVMNMHIHVDIRLCSETALCNYVIMHCKFSHITMFRHCINMNMHTYTIEWHARKEHGSEDTLKTCMNVSSFLPWISDNSVEIFFSFYVFEGILFFMLLLNSLIHDDPIICRGLL